MAEPLVSVLIPTYNYGRFLGECLESVLAQTTDAPLEILVVDDGSDDDTRAVAANYPVRYLRQAHSGVAAARNRGIREACGQWIAFIDADDLWTPEKLALQLAAVAREPEAEIVFCPVRNQYRNGDSATEAHIHRLSEDVRHFLIPALISRALLLRMGGFSEEYDRGEDTELLCRMRLSHVNMRFCVETPCYIRRLHGENLTLRTCPGVQDARRVIASAIRRSRRTHSEEE